ncbi:putative phage-type endonuclease [Nonomuraea thailandensis]|uniref:Phage-type endonuclease n=1 Tax=Nonomuraea thailandensis TaxID=1188745 RepID=A0A9X2GUK2_9ACTN|nr:YqaJ viral recombinase family protein [Nonomuraea thailandensis]MCP2364245.1 putative phage-type endonuclease [Nonomuraea thailandensis]
MTATKMSGLPLVTPTGRLIAPAGLPREEFLANRLAGIGGSDIAAVLGMHRHTSPIKLYLEKRGELPPLPRPAWLEEAADIGSDLEEFIASRFARMTGTWVEPIGTLQHVDRAWMLVNLDRRVEGCDDGPCFVECKNRSEYQFEDWRDGVPDEPALQVHWGIGVSGYSHGHLAALIGGNKFRHVRIDRDEQLLSHLVEAGERFMKRVLDGDPPPIDGSDATTELLAHLFDVHPDAIRELDPAKITPLLAERDRLKAEVKEREQQLSEIDNQLTAELGDAEIAQANNQILYTAKKNGVFANKRFEEAHPEIAARLRKTVSVLDVEAVKEQHPDEYRAHRARVIRPAKPRKKAA